MDAEEERIFHMAIAKSKIETQRNSCKSVPSAKIFRPSLEEFQDPMIYLQRGVKTCWYYFISLDSEFRVV